MTKASGSLRQRLDRLHDRNRMRGLDWYEAQLDRDDLDPALRDEYDREANRLAAVTTRQQDEAAARKEAATRRTEEIRQMLLDGNSNVVDLYGVEEFGADYSTDITRDTSGVYRTWHITSTVARADQSNSWSFDNEMDAKRHLHSLIYDRMYYKYVRLGKVDSLQELPSFV